MNLDNIKRISIREYLGARDIKPQHERGNRAMYLSPFRQENNPSFSVDYDQNVWYDHGTGEGGSIIDLVARMENCAVAEAIRRLEDNTSLPTINRSGTADSRRIEIVSVSPLNHPALVGYLRDRNIDMIAARKYCNEIRYSIGGKEYFAIGFKNDAGGWELRNPYFKGSSIPKNITTLNNGSDTVMVFEGFTDFLSYLTLKANPSPSIDTAVLNSVTNLQKAIPFLTSHATVHAFLDNDDAGRKALEKLRSDLSSSEVVDQSVFYRNYKDLNDYIRKSPEPETSARKENPTHRQPRTALSRRKGKGIG